MEQDDGQCCTDEQNDPLESDTRQSWADEAVLVVTRGLSITTSAVAPAVGQLSVAPAVGQLSVAPAVGQLSVAVVSCELS